MYNLLQSNYILVVSTNKPPSKQGNEPALDEIQKAIELSHSHRLGSNHLFAKNRAQTMTQVFLANSAEKKKHKTTMTKTAVRKSRIMTALLSCFSFINKESLAQYSVSQEFVRIGSSTPYRNDHSNCAPLLG